MATAKELYGMKLGDTLDPEGDLIMWERVPGGWIRNVYLSSSKNGKKTDMIMTSTFVPYSNEFNPVLKEFLDGTNKNPIDAIMKLL